LDIFCFKRFLQLAQLISSKELRGFSINQQSLDETMINMTFFRDDPDDAFQDFHLNCAYLGYKNTIVGDLRFLRQLSGIDNIPEYGKTSSGEDITAILTATMSNTAAIWVIGHEIGHLACGHDLRHFRFDKQSDSQVIENPDGRPNGASHAIEQEADEFVWQALEGIPLTIFALGLRSTVLKLANRQLLLQGERPDTPWGIENRTFKLHKHSSTHPPILLRAVLIAQRISEGLVQAGLGNEDRDHFLRIYEHITVG
jgi:hypothetical protein